MLYIVLIVVVNVFINIKVYIFVIIYERKACASRVIYFYLDVMLLQLLYY